MGEKVIIRGTTKEYGGTPAVVLIIGGIALLIDIIYGFSRAVLAVDMAHYNTQYDLEDLFHIFLRSFWSGMTKPHMSFIPILLLPSVICICIGLFLLIKSNCEIVVTDKRVYGKAVFFKDVNLPIESIVGTSASYGITVISSAGKYTFWGITNGNGVRSAISDLLMERQPMYDRTVSTPNTYLKEKEEKEIILDGGWKCDCGRVNYNYMSSCSCGRNKWDVGQTDKERIPVEKTVEEHKLPEERRIEKSNAEQIKEFKELLDIGAITQEEYDTKKKQLLGL